jgi:hypothetical protein
MSAASPIIQITDRNLKELLAAQRAILILSKTTCGACHTYQAEIEARLAQGELGGVAIGKIILDERGALQFKRDNRWLAGLKFLPYTLLYDQGRQVDGFAASKGAYLMERVEEAFVGRTWVGVRHGEERESDGKRTDHHPGPRP